MQPTRRIGRFPILNLPEEIVTDIFLKLPVKTLTLVSCVNQFCNRLISRPDFVKAHLKVSKEDDSLSSYRVLFCEQSEFCVIQQCSINSFVCENFTDVVSLDCPKKGDSKRVRVVGSCNGLICIVTDDERIFLWNPVTNQSNQLPRIDENDRISFPHTYGFCYVESDDDYKVLVVGAAFKKRELYILACVYCLNSNSWKRKEVENFALEDEFGVLSNENLHWLTDSVENDIVSFDIESDLFGTVKQPNYDDGWFDSSLGVLRGCLSVLCKYEGFANIWVLKEYGVVESWTKVFTISYDIPEEHFCLKAEFVLPNGKLVLRNWKCYLIYDPKENTLRTLPKERIDGDDVPFIYVESLVSPAV